jgi:SAM-dependent methyltransferase
MAEHGGVPADMAHTRGVAWGEHHPDLFVGTERFFRTNYIAHLTDHWIPALEGMEAKLRAGATVADVGCGHGASTVILAQAYPRSSFVGYDFHEPSIDVARKAAAEAGVADRCRFEIAEAASYPGRRLDLVTLFDCLHDWVIRWGRPRTSVKRWPRTAPACSLSRMQKTSWKTI